MVNLSKSTINLYLQCPLKYKFVKVDKRMMPTSPQMQRGIDIHKKIEDFYKDVKIHDDELIIQNKDDDLNRFYEDEIKRAEAIIKKEKSLQKYFYPIAQELYMEDDDLQLKGFVDAVFINPDDDKYIVIDWKTGKCNEKNLDSYRLELTVYKLLYEKMTGRQVGYWGIYFSDEGKLFFEKAKLKYVEDNERLIDYVRRSINEEKYEPKKNKYCNFCPFKEECELMN